MMWNLAGVISMLNLAAIMSCASTMGISKSTHDRRCYGRREAAWAGLCLDDARTKARDCQQGRQAITPARQSAQVDERGGAGSGPQGWQAEQEDKDAMMWFLGFSLGGNVVLALLW